MPAIREGHATTATLGSFSIRMLPARIVNSATQAAMAPSQD